MNMRLRTLVTLGLVLWLMLGLTLPGFPPGFPPGFLPVEAVPLKSVSLAQGPWGCDGILYVNSWVNTTGKIVQITSVTQWIGFQQYVGGVQALADITLSIHRRSDNSDVAWFLYDRYTSPAGPHQVTTDFAPHSVDLAPGDALDFYVACTAVGGPPSVAHAYTTFRYLVN